MSKIILVVEDDNELRQMLAQELDQNGFEVWKASNGLKALQILKAKTPDLLITDWDMPEMNGIMLLQHIKKMPSTQQFPVIMMSGMMTESKSAIYALNMYALEFLRKPVEIAELLARIRAVFRIKEAENTLKEFYEKEKKWFEERLLQKEKELDHLKNMVLVRNQTIHQIKKDLDKLLVENNFEPQLLQEKLEKQQDQNQEWRYFLFHLEKIHPHFWNKITAISEISENEARICAYLRVGMNNREIALLHNVTISAIQKNRYRIRKKMNIESEEIFLEFLKNI
ncbi:MAG: response regulator [Bacteroidetes bacterium]|nr:MAG: response regulator [Bacteroidota bacterium]